MPAKTAQTGWLFGPVPDLFLGCGLGYLLLASLHLLTGEALAGAIPGGLLILIFSLPHYGATLVRVYESAEDRARYRVLAVHVTLALIALFAVSLHVALLGSLVLTLYLTWSPWHYTGQNYGVVLMLLARRGIAVDPVTKRWIHASFVGSFGLAFLALHSALPGASYAPVNWDDTTVQLIPLGIPFPVAAAGIALLGVGYGVTLGVSLFRVLRAGSLAALAPAALLVATQAIWFSLPVLLRTGGWLGQTGPDSPLSAYGFLWVASAHAAQYLWITLYYVTTADPGRSKTAFLGRAALAGFAVWIIPGLVFAPGLLGGLTYDSGLALVVASVVNLHHFVLDGAIWKLRDGRIARVLLRSSANDDAAVTEAGAWRRWAVAVAGSASIVIAGIGFWESEFGFHRAVASGNYARAERAIERFAWIGRDGAAKRVALAQRLAFNEEYDRASLQLERAIAVETSADANYFLGLVREHQERWQEARGLYERALELDPSRADARLQSALMALELGDAGLAAKELAYLIELDPMHEQARELLVRARVALRARPDAGAVESR